MTIFLPKIGMSSDRPECLRFGLSWDLGLWLHRAPRPPPTPSLLHSSVHAGLELPAPVSLCLPGLTEGKLQKAQSPYTSSPEGSLAQPVGEGGRGAVLAGAEEQSRVWLCSTFPLSSGRVTSSSHSSLPEPRTGLDVFIC